MLFNIICLLFSVSLYNKAKVTYDYVGQNFPENLPLNVGTIEMIFDDSIRYSISKNVSFGMWLTKFPVGAGYIHLGPEDRAFYMAMWHELHCLEIIYSSLEPDTETFGGVEHLQHCLNYLRQYFLCNADDVLEPGDYHTETTSFVRKCFDWQTIFDFNARNRAQFDKNTNTRSFS